MDLHNSVVKVDGENFGTGCVVAPRVVLTALHVVSRSYDLGKNCNTPPKALVQGKSARLLWPAVPFKKASLDLALLEVDKECGVPLPVDAAWPVGAAFLTRGFPGSASGPVDPYGWLRQHEVPHLQRLDCSAGPKPDQGENWPGISGAPVVVAGRVRGVVIHRVPDWRDLLDAVPLSLALGDPEFAKHLPMDGPDSTLADRIRAAIANDPNLRDELLTAARILDQAQLAELLLRGDVVTALEAIEQGHARCVTAANESRRRADRDLAEALFRIAGMVVAARAPLVEATPWGGFVVVAFTDSGIELAAARHSGRAVEFARVDDQRDVGPGRHRLPWVPDRGRVCASDMEKHLREKLKLGAPEIPAEYVNLKYEALRKSEPLYLGAYLAQVGDDASLKALHDFQARFPRLPVVLGDRTKSPEGALEINAVPILNRIHLAHKQLFVP